MSYIIRHKGSPYENGARGPWYVAKPGHPQSYTRRLENARQWPTEAAAQRECCGNETVISLYRAAGGA